MLGLSRIGVSRDVLIAAQEAGHAAKCAPTTATSPLRQRATVSLITGGGAIGLR